MTEDKTRKIAKEIATRALEKPLKISVLATRIVEPEKGQIVLYPNRDKGIRPVQIISGKWWGHHGVSNFWTWKDLISGEEETGYGFFYEMQAEEVKDDQR